MHDKPVIYSILDVTTKGLLALLKNYECEYGIVYYSTDALFRDMGISNKKTWKIISTNSYRKFNAVIVDHKTCNACTEP